MTAVVPAPRGGTALPPPPAPLCPDGGIPAGSVPRPGWTSTVPLRSLSVVIVCRNARAGLRADVREAATGAALASEDYEVVVVDDGSADGTAAVAAALAAACSRVRLVAHPAPRGYGAAVRSGIAAARLEWVLLADAGGELDLRELADIVPLTAWADAVWGWRVLRHGSPARRAAEAARARLLGTLLRLPMRDAECAFRLVRRTLLDGLELHASGSAVGAELALRCRDAGARLSEAAVHQRRPAARWPGDGVRVLVRDLVAAR